jgi:predicted nuclease of restriction endonuclease-like (RecB) superfamily
LEGVDGWLGSRIVAGMVISGLEDSSRMQPELGRATTMSSEAPTADAMLPEAPESYQRTLDALVERVQAARVRALRSVNQELVLLYWDIGREILDRQEREGWGAKVVDRLARDLRSLFPDMGMSARNLKYMRAFAKAWRDPEIVQGRLAQSPFDRKVPQAVAQIPWGHIRTLLDKLDDSDVRLWYATKAAEHGWSRSVLVHQIEGALHLREGKGLTNFDETLPSPQSEIAQQITKNPYIFGFLGLDEQATERALEHGLMAHVERFLLEMGEGFAVVGRQRDRRRVRAAGHQHTHPSLRVPNPATPRAPTARATRHRRDRGSTARPTNAKLIPSGGQPLPTQFSYRPWLAHHAMDAGHGGPAPRPSAQPPIPLQYESPVSSFAR